MTAAYLSAYLSKWDVKRRFFSVCVLLCVLCAASACSAHVIETLQADMPDAVQVIQEVQEAPEVQEATNAPGALPEEIEPEPTVLAVSITFMGDVLLDSGVKRLYSEHGYDGIFSNAGMPSSDITMINLELPFSTRGVPEPDKQWTFRGDPRHIKFLAELGVSIVTVANNHSLDYGRDAFSDTLALLTENNIPYVGGGLNYEEASSYKILEVNGVKIAFVAASAVLPTVEWYAGKERSGLFATYDPTAVNEKIALACLEADYVIVYVHWGVEKDSVPSERQRKMAKGYIDAGASCVVGSHPHVLQGFEYYKGKPIMYSLGNFIFTDARKDTMAVTVTLDEQITVSAAPYLIRNMKTIPAVEEADRGRILQHLRDISFGVSIDNDFAVYPKD